MVKKIGNLLFCLICSIYLSGQQSLTMRVLDMNGQALEQAAVGVPFNLEVVIASDQSIQDMPTVKGLEKIHVEQQGLVSTINSIVNGVGSYKKIYRYVLRADKEGSYILGPATINGVTSKNLTIMVSKQQQKASSALELRVDKEKAFIGEPIEYTIRFYTTPTANLVGMSQPDFSGFLADPVQGPFSGSQIINGKSADYLEWKTTLYAQKIGTFTLPALHAAYREPRQRRSHHLDFFASLFDAGFDQKYIYSNAVAVIIEPLPPYKFEVQAVGSFSNLKASVDHAKAHVGEAIVYTLEFEGKGNIQWIPAPRLNLPAEFTSYDSKQGVVPLPDGSYKKYYEYIIQGMKVGEWTVPAQTFVYFDPKTRTYKELVSSTCAVTIMPAQDTQQQSEPTKNTQKTIPETVTVSDANQLTLIESWSVVQEHPRLSWKLFIALLLVPLLILAIMYSYKWFATYRQTYKYYRYKEARNSIKKAFAQKQYTHVYDTMIQQLAVLLSKEPSTLSLETIAHELQLRGFTTHELRAWNSYFEQLLACSFYQHSCDVRSLEQETYVWLQRLHKVR